MTEGEETLTQSRLRERVGRRDLQPVFGLEKIAIEFLLSRVKAAFEQVDDVFFDLADRADNNTQQPLYFDAMRVIRLERGRIEKEFKVALEHAFKGLRENSPVGSSFESSAGKSALEIVDNEDLEEMIALDTMVSRCRDLCKPDLDFLSERLDYLVDVSVTQNNNPAGPEILCDALGSATKALPLDIRSRLVLLKLFDRQILSRLKELVVLCNQSLSQQGVLPDLEIRRKQKKSPNQKTATPPPPPLEECTTASAEADTPKTQGHGATGRVLSQLTSWLNKLDSSTTASHANQRDSAPSMSDLFSAISVMHEKRASSDGLAESELQSRIATALMDQLSSSGADENLRAVDRGIVQLVDKLFHQLGGRLQTSTAMVSRLKKLDLAILKVALQDHEFFDRERHPARRLLNEVVQASVAFQEDEDLTSDPVAKYISQITESLVNEKDLDNSKLTLILADFLDLIERDQRRSASLEQRLLEQVAASERINEAHRKVNGILQQRLMGKDVPKILVSFAQQAWCKVLFMDCLRHSSKPEQLQLDTELLDRLLYLADGHEALSSSNELTQILSALKERLTEISFDAYETGSLLGGIEQYFSAKQAFQKDLETDKRALENISLELKTLFEKIQVESVKSELPGQVDDGQSDVENSMTPEAEQALEALAKGSWIEYQDEAEGSKRCRVAGIVTPPGKYVFVNRRGGKVSEKYRRRVALEIEQGKLVVLDNSHLFEDVLEDVIRNIHSEPAVGSSSQH